LEAKEKGQGEFRSQKQTIERSGPIYELDQRGRTLKRARAIFNQGGPLKRNGADLPRMREDHVGEEPDTEVNCSTKDHRALA